MLPPTVKWEGDIDGHLELIDQTLLPAELKFIGCHDLQTLWHAIKVLRVRGAPAIGVAAAYGPVIAAQHANTSEDILQRVEQACDYLATARPTAVNLFWALDRMRNYARQIAHLPPKELRQALLKEAKAIHEEDIRMCRAIGEYGDRLIPQEANILTHCNAGSLATSHLGTALAVMYIAAEKGKKLHVWVDETRPLLQGARLTCWELHQAGIDATLICDNMAASAMGQGKIDLVITGADRIAANGDTANKIGTYGLAVLANYHNIPFYIAAPVSTFDLSIPDGSHIPIEQRQGEEVRRWGNHQTAPADAKVWNPAFDVTPAGLITAIITDRGIIEKPNRQNIAALVGT